MTKERACRHCGCTETTACLTAAGPCSWASETCCSNPVCLGLEGQKTHLMDLGAGSLYATHGTACGIRLQKKGIGNKIFHVANAPGYGDYIHPRSVVGRNDRALVDCSSCLRVMKARRE